MKNEIKENSRQSFLKTVLQIAIPVSLQALIANSLGMVDQIMIGQLGEVCVTAVSLGGRPCFILIFALGGICAAASIFASQAEGAGDKAQHSKIMKASIAGCFLCVVPFFVLSFFFPSFTLTFFTSDSAVIQKGSVYLKIVSISYFAEIILLSASAILRATGNAKVPLVTGFVSVVTNTALNAILIFGHFGFPAMGERGAAFATVIARFLEAAILIIFMIAKKHPASIEKAFGAKCEKSFLRNFFITALPAIGNELLWAIGDAAYSAIYGHLGTFSLASMTLTFPVQGLSVGFFSGLSASAAIIIGNNLGSGKFDEAYKNSWHLIKYSVIGCIVMSAFLCFARGFYVNLYEVDDAVKTVASDLLLIFSAYLPVKVLNMVVGSGIIRSGGETKYTLFLDVVGTYAIGLPLGIISAFVFKLPMQAVYAILSIEEIWRLVMGLRRVKMKKWIKQVYAKNSSTN